MNDKRSPKDQVQRSDKNKAMTFVESMLFLLCMFLNLIKKIKIPE